MSQDAGASQSGRSSGPAYVYGPMIYQFPPEREVVETEKAKPKSAPSPSSAQGVNFLVLLLIVVLVVGGVILYLKEHGIDIRQLSSRRSDWKEQTFNSANEGQRQFTTQARVATDGLYLREGPGMEYVATYLLPANWDVSLVGDYQTDNDGEVWVRVFVETDEGLQEGWVSQRFLE